MQCFAAVSELCGFEAAGRVRGMIVYQVGAGSGMVGLVGPVRFWAGGLFIAGGHTASNAPDLFRPPKLSGAGPG